MTNKLRELQERRSQKPHVRLARKFELLAHPSLEVLESLADTLIEMQEVAAYKGKGDGMKAGKNESVAPGHPTVAGYIAELESSAQRIDFRRKNNLRNMRKELARLTAEGNFKLANFEARAAGESSNIGQVSTNGC